MAASGIGTYAWSNMLLPLGPKEWIFCQLMASAFITCLNLLLWSLIADAVDIRRI